MTPHPFRDATLSLKQLNLGQLSELGRQALDQCFSGFLTSHAPSEAAVAEGMRHFREFLADGIQIDSPNLAFDRARPRRYAGDQSLGRGNYYSVCSSGGGDDGETLLRELEAYYSPLDGGVIDLFDSTIPSHQALVHANAASLYEASLVLVLHPINNQPHTFTRRFTLEPKQHWVVLPLAITTVHIEKVVDLRVPDVADWFARGLSRCKFSIEGSTEVEAFPVRPALASFRELLPSLLDQSVGGGHSVSQIAGLWLRYIGANGLVYPSARSDASVVVHGGDVSESYGWCFVDYRGAPDPTYAGRFDLGSEWSKEIAWEPADITDGTRKVFTNASITYTHDGVRARSWAVSGLQAERRSELLRDQVVSMLCCVLGDDLLSDSDARALLKVMHLDRSVNHVGGLCHEIKTAVLGHPDAQAKLGEYWRSLAAAGLRDEALGCIRTLARLGCPLCVARA